MKIGIDCRMWNETGMGRYIRNVVKQLFQLDSQNEYVLFHYNCKENYNKDSLSQLELPPNFKKVPANVHWHTLAEQTYLLNTFLKEKLDLLHIPTPNIPILYPKKFIVTIHDLTVLRVNTGRATTLPYPLYALKRFGFKTDLYVAIKRSEKIFTVSNYVKNDLVQTYNVPPNKIVLTKNAVDSKFKPYQPITIDPILEKYNIKPPYLFYIGNAYPHKNLEKLIEAFKLISKEFPELSLVLAGKKDFFYKRLEQELTKENLKVFFPGFIYDNDLPALYSGSALFVNPSLYEGFGIQVLEAFACGTKVACSNTTSLPEVGEDVAYYFDPRNVRSIKDALVYALQNNDSVRSARGQDVVSKYNWRSTAQTVLNTYNTLK